MITRGVLGLTMLLALTACSSDDGASAQAGTPSSRSSTSSTPTAPTPPTPTPPTPTPPAPKPKPTPKPTAVPTARNGISYAACSDGNCEVLIRKTARFRVLGDKLTFTVSKSTMSISTRRSDGSGFDTSFGIPGSAGWGTVKGGTTSATLTAANGSTAILKLTTG